MAGNYHTKSNWFSKWYIRGRQQYNGYSCYSKETGYVCHHTWMCTMLSCLQEKLIDSKLCFWWLVPFVLTTVWKINFNRDLLGGAGGFKLYLIFLYFSASFKINDLCLWLQFPKSWETIVKKITIISRFFFKLNLNPNTANTIFPWWSYQAAFLEKLHHDSIQDSATLALKTFQAFNCIQKQCQHLGGKLKRQTGGSWKNVWTMFKNVRDSTG